jgi:outer membrane protein OmpU
MKKILLATTVLGMTAGVAAAQDAAISFKGEAAAGFAQNGVKNGGKTSLQAAAATKTADSTTNPYTYFKLSVSGEKASDSGVTFGVSASIESGVNYTMANDDGFSAKTGAMGRPTISLSGDFGKVALKADGFKEYQDDNAEKYDLEYTHTVAGLSIGVRTDLHGTADSATTAGKSSVKLGYTAGAIALNAAYDEVGAKWGVTAGYTMGAITATIGTDNANVSSLKLAYKGDNGITADIKGKSNNEVEANVGYTANGLTLGATVTSGTKVGGVDTNKWKVTAAYDLGGGLSAVAGANYTDDMYLGAKMSF